MCRGRVEAINRSSLVYRDREMASVENSMTELVLALVDDVLRKGSEDSSTGPSEPKRSRPDYEMEKRDFSLVPHIPGMDWANCSWANPWDSLYPANSSSDI